MVCSECGKRPATMHYVQTVNGVTTEKHLCSECAAKHQELNSLNFFSAGDFFKSFFDFGEQMPAVMGGPACKTCGLTLGDFRETGLLGCPDCYSSFRDAIIPVLRSTHGNVQHVGDTPENGSEESKRRREIEELKAKMQKAIQEENFEEAAKLRDEINAKKGEEKE